MMGHWSRRAVAASLALALLVAPVWPIGGKAAGAAAKAAEPEVRLVGEQPVTAGATLRKYVWTSVRNGQPVSANANVLVVDLHNPYVKLDVMTGKSGKFTERATVQQMAAHSGAVAGVNGDFYSVSAEGAPIGPQIAGGELQSTPSQLNGLYAFAITKENQPIIDRFTFSGAIIAQNGASYPLAGINKTYYWRDPDKLHSHVDALYIYTSAWGSAARANDGATVPTEVLVKGDVVQEISVNKALPVAPPEDGYILRASGKAAAFVTENLNVGDTIRATYELKPADPTKTYDTAGFKMMIGGHTILVDGGAPAAYSRDVTSLGGYRSRTGLGYSQDGRRVYLITVDNSGSSKGMSLSEFQQFMIRVGVWKGLNLDGGGSTQMVVRPLGDEKAVLANATEYSTARQVVNGLGVYTLAPKGKLAGLIIAGQEAVLLNEQVTFSLKAYDEYYNPYDLGDEPIHWTVADGSGAFDGDRFTAAKPGTVRIAAMADGGIEKSAEIEVVGGKQIGSMAISAPEFVVSDEGTYALPEVSVTTLKGVTRRVPAELVDWEFVGFDGVVEEGVLKVKEVEGGGIARIIARYDGFGAMLTRPAGMDRLFADFDELLPDISSAVTPAEVKAAVRKLSGLHPHQSGNAALTFDYNFRDGSGTKAAYAVFGEDGVWAAVEGEPDRMKMKVLGDGSLNWLRAEFVDAAGRAHLVDIANPVDWYGWKNVNVDLTAYNMAYPVKLKRIYVASPANGQEEREPVGFIAVDDIVFQYKGEVPAEPKVSVQMAVGRPSITVDGEPRSLEVAPTLVNGTTFIPVRFFVDALGGQIAWDEDERRVTILRGDRMIDLWIGEKSAVMDGKRVTVPEAPRIMKERTMLPLRFIAEALGWQVGWDAKTQSVTLQ